MQFYRILLQPLFMYLSIYHSWLSYKTIYLNFTKHKS